MKAMKELGTMMIATVKRKASAFETFKVIFSKSQYVKALFCLVFIRMAYFHSIMVHRVASRELASILV